MRPHAVLAGPADAGPVFLCAGFGADLLRFSLRLAVMHVFQQRRKNKMKNRKSAMMILAFAAFLAGGVQARDTKHLLPIEDAMKTDSAEAKLEGNVKFFFGDQQHPKVLSKLGTDVSNRKTNAFNKGDETACNWAFLSALLALETRAKELGANAVVNVVSYYKKDTYSSKTDFECHAGALMAGVALKGDFVKIGDK
jgi:hypothetical protein